MLQGMKYLARCLVILVISLGLAACDDAAPTDLLPIAQQQVAVNDELVIPLSVQNEAGDALRFRFEGPQLPGLERVTTISSTPTGGEFRWTPIASHVGFHELIFVVEDLGGDELDRETALIEIIPAEDAAPVFLRPGAGGTYDLTRAPCIELDIEVRDDDSSSVTIDARSKLPEGATLTERGPKRAFLEWCPTVDQVAVSERWTLEFSADDGDHPPVEHNYIVVLRTGAKANCPGEPPTITLLSPDEGARVSSSSGYDVRASVTDDGKLRDAPLLYYTTEPPENLNNPDITDFEQVIFTLDGAEFTARIPSLGLAEGEEQALFFLVSATDNDDPTGALCDHRTDSPLRSFIAVGSSASPDRELCQSCGASSECSSGFCASSAGGGRCAQPCPEGTCSSGECTTLVTVEGGTRKGCGPLEATCEGTESCTDDAREDADDDPASATPLGLDESLEGTLCPGDDDYFVVAGNPGERFEVVLSGLTDDLDLELLSATGSLLAVSASAESEERVGLCFSADSPRIFAAVYGFQGATSDYTLSVLSSTEPCCVDDPGEPDDALDQPRTLAYTPGVETSFDGTICPGDDDYIAFDVNEPSTLDIYLVFDGNAADLDLELYGPDGTLVAQSRDVTDTESIAIQVAGTGTYTLRVYGFDAGDDEYLGGLTVTPSVTCTTTLDCPRGTLCDSGACIEIPTCDSSAACPTEHLCTPLGPVPAASVCSASCSVNADCRSGEACKRHDAGRACGRTGSGANGDACDTFEDCGGQRACHGWSGGYCARLGCTDDGDCESGTYCASVEGQNVCTLSCVASDDVCRLSEGYRCNFRETISAGSRFLCVP